MRQARNAIVSPDRESKSQFGVWFEKSFVLSDDCNHVIAPDPSDLRRILVEDLTRGSSFCFGANEKTILTLFFDEDSRTLLAGDYDGHLVEYELDLKKRKGRVTKKHGDLEIGGILSYSVSMGFVLFGGGSKKVRVYYLPSQKMLQGDMETSIRYVLSLQVCVVDESRVYLAVLGAMTNYSSTRSDLYDLGDLLGKVSVSGGLVNDHRLLLTQRKSKNLRTQKKLSETLEEKLVRLQIELTQKTFDHETLLTQNEELMKKNTRLENEKASHEEIIRTMMEANEQLNQKVSEAESRLKKYKNRLQETLDQKSSMEAMLRRLKKTSKARINRLGLKLRILNMKRDTLGNPKNRRQVKNQLDPVYLIRDLEHKLYAKTNEWTDMKNAMLHAITENTRYEGQIEAKEEEIEKITHQLMNIRAANREG